MAAIDIPDEYWTIEPRGFAALVAPFKDGLDAIRGDVLSGAAGFDGDVGDNVAAAVATVDGDSDAIAADAQGVYTGVETANTGGVLANYTPGDNRVTNADAATPPADLPPGASRHSPPQLVPPDGAIDPTTGAIVGIAVPKDPNAGSANSSARQADTPPAAAAPSFNEPTPTPDVAPPLESTGADVAVLDTNAADDETFAETPPVDPATLPITRGELAQILDSLNATIVVMV